MQKRRKQSNGLIVFLFIFLCCKHFVGVESVRSKVDCVKWEKIQQIVIKIFFALLQDFPERRARMIVYHYHSLPILPCLPHFVTSFQQFDQKWQQHQKSLMTAYFLLVAKTIGKTLQLDEKVCFSALSLICLFGGRRGDGVEQM